MRKLLVVLLAILAVMTAWPARAEMVTVGQMPRGERWTETVETVNGPVRVDVTISLPELERLPVYEVARRQFTADELRRCFPQAEMDLQEAGAVVTRGDPSGMIYPIYPDRCVWTGWPEGGDYAEAAPESRRDVEEKLRAMWEGLYGGQTSLWTRGISAYSRTWQRERSGELAEPVSEHGYYNLYLELALDGVTVYDDLFFNRDGGGVSGPHAEHPQAQYYDENNFQVLLTDMEIVRVIAQDVPILPLEAIRETLRVLISTGHLREIYRMELCYLPMWSDDRGGIVTVPAWVVHGEYHEAAKAPGDEDTDSYYLRTMGGYALVIPAQTGQVIDYADASARRWLASTYLTEW